MERQKQTENKNGGFVANDEPEELTARSAKSPGGNKGKKTPGKKSGKADDKKGEQTMAIQSQVKDKKDKQTDWWYAWARYIMDVDGGDETSSVKDKEKDKEKDKDKKTYESIQPIAKNKFRDVQDKMSKNSSKEASLIYYV